MITRKTKAKPQSLKVTGYHNILWQRNLAAVMVLILCVLLGLSINSNNEVAKSFAVQPAFLLRLDTKTGLTEVTQSVHSPSMEIAEEELYLQNAIMQYVVRRERYHSHTFEYDQAYTSVYSEGRALASYTASVAPTNPRSMTANLKDKGFADVTVTNIVKLKSAEYQVNWQLAVYRSGIEIKPKIYKVRTILRLKPFDETSIPEKKKDRLLNPFGMKITRYQNQSETI